MLQQIDYFSVLERYSVAKYVTNVKEYYKF